MIRVRTVFATVAIAVAALTVLPAASAAADVPDVSAPLASCAGFTYHDGSIASGNILGVSLWQAAATYSCSSADLLIVGAISIVSAVPPNGNVVPNACPSRSSCNFVSLPAASFLVTIIQSVAVGANAAGGFDVSTAS